MAKINSNSVTFVDLTESRKLEVYINSNLPTTQIRNLNNNTYTPDWSVTNLILSADIFLDSKELKIDTIDSIKWYKKVGTSTETEIGTNQSITVSTNEMSKDNASIITYICKVTYQNLESQAQLAFARVDTGLDGADGNSAPAVLAEYSADSANWVRTLDSSIHKYIRFSYDNGATWTTAIKMTGEDGTSVTITGTAYFNGTLSNNHIGQNVILYSDATFTTVVNTTSLHTGDAYIVQGYLCVYNKASNAFICTGVIQGPQGAAGTSSYVFIRYATDANGANISDNPSGKTYIGFYTSSVNNAPTDARLYTWRKFVGDNAKSIVLSGNSQVFKISKSNGITPATITVTAQAINTTISDSGWTYSINGGQTFLSTVPSGVSRNGNIITITGATMTENSIVIKASDGTYNDVFTVYKVSDGTDGANGVDGQSAPVAFLTNENVSFSANADGQITATTFTTNVVAYKGTTKVAPIIGTITGLPTGMTVSNPIITANEGILTFSIANNTTLGATTSTSGTITIPITSPVSTNLKLSWSKINTGATGEPGTAGSDAYTVILTNESHVFAGDVSSAIAGEATTQILAYKGVTPQNVTITSVNGKTATIVDADTGIVGLTFKCDTLNGTSPKITFTCTKSFVSQNGSIPIVLSVGGVPFTKMFTYSIAFKGATGGTGSTGPTGPASTAYWLISSASVIQKTATGTITATPSTLTFTGKSQTGTALPIDYACRWIIAYSTDGTNYNNLYTSSANETSKSITVATTYKTIRARMYLAGGTTTLLDEQIIPVISDGAKGDKGNQGDRGAGISSVTVTYGVSTDVSTQPTSWQTTLPTVAEGSYLWTRTVTDYTDASIADTVTLTYAKQGAKGSTGSAGTSVTVSSIQYQAGTSATTAPTGTWSNSVVTVAEGSYLWTKTTFSDGKVAYGVAKQGVSGRGVSSITEYYLASTSSTGVTTSTSGWTTAIQSIDASKKYLWNYELITYTDNDTSTTTPVIIGVFGNTGATGAAGKGIKSVTEYYLATESSSNVTTSTSGWTTAIQTLTATKKYLWNYEIITYTDNTTTTINPVIIGVYGDQGTPAISVMLSSEAHLFDADSRGVPVAASITLNVIGYQGLTQSATTVGTITGLPSSGMTATILNNSATNTQIQIAVTEALTSVDSGILTIPVTVNGKVINKQFSWIKSKDGLTGERGSDAIIFQVYSANGYVLSKDTPSITLQTFAYNGDVPIEAGATYQWYKYTGGNWTAIADATNGYLNISHSDVSFSGSYMCKMLFNDIEYVGVATIDDKNDTNIVFTSKPSSYAAGDIWIVGGDYAPSGVITGTVLKAEYPSNTYRDQDWITATKYDKAIDDINKHINTYNQYFDFDDEEGLKITAIDKNGVASKFSTTLTNEQLSFNYGDKAVAYINGTSMHIKEAEIESPLTITGKYEEGVMKQPPILNIGNFSIVVESNGSLSIVSNI